ncbi:MAG: cell division protein FtsQ/DivIB [Brachymonas sp.]
MDEKLTFLENRLLSPSYWRVLAYAVVMMVLCVTVVWLAHRPSFDWRRVTLNGEVTRVNLQTLKNQTASGLDGNFWTLNLRNLQRQFEQVPWVRRAVLHRQFPDTLSVQIEEQVPSALWQSESSSAYVNGFGEVFEADASELADGLPLFKGQESQSVRMMNMYVALRSEVERRGMQIREIALSRGGSWSLILDSDAKLELGRGSDRELQARLQHFFAACQEIYPSKSVHEALLMIASADLRYQNGFGVRLRSNAEGNRVE